MVLLRRRVLEKLLGRVKSMLMGSIPRSSGMRTKKAWPVPMSIILRSFEWIAAMTEASPLQFWYIIFLFILFFVYYICVTLDYR